MARLSFFGRLSDTVPSAEQTFSLPVSVRNTTELRRWLSERFMLAVLLDDRSIRIAVNDEIVCEPHGLCDEDHIAFLPPVGGG
jgi:molybdopterin converting factor small subunit